MEKILQEMRSLETRFTTQMEADRRVTNEKFEADRKAFAERTTTLTVVIGVVGATIALIGIAITILLFLKN